VIRLLAVFLFFSVLIAAPADAEDMTPRQREILMTAINADGWLTEAMHHEFWDAVPEEIRSDTKALAFIVSMMERGFLDAVRFQREAWGSMKRSLATHTAVKTPSYEAAKAAMLVSNPHPEYRRQAEVGARNAEAMIESAATGKPMASQKGTFYVTEEMIDRVLTGLDGSIHRLRRLTNPVWSAKVEEYSFPDVHVRILWDGPFRREAEDIKVEGGKPAKITVLTHQLSEKEIVQIGFVRMQVRWAHPESAVMRVVSSSLDAMGVADASPASMRWRGRISAEGDGTAKTSEDTIHISVRVVEAKEHGGLWQIIGMSAGSRVEAIGLRETLEQALQLTGVP
jgi:hypothetical protein